MPFARFGAVLVGLALSAMPLAAQEVARSGDSVRLILRLHAASPWSGERVIGRLTAVTDTVVIETATGPRVIARHDVRDVQRLMGHGYDWRRARTLLLIGGAAGAVIGLKVSEGEAGNNTAAVTVLTMMGMWPGFMRGLDSRGRAGARIGAGAGFVVGLAVGFATMPEAVRVREGAWGVNPFGGIRPIPLSVLGAWAGSTVGGGVGSLKPGDRWREATLESPTLVIRALSAGRAGVGISTTIPVVP